MIVASMVIMVTGFGENEDLREKRQTWKNKGSKNVGVRVSLLTALGNLLISIVYLAAGYFGQSISVISEGVDNLTDAGGSLLLLLGFKLSGRKADSRHPYGHGRAEYIVGLLISEIILFAAFSLGRNQYFASLSPCRKPPCG